MTDNDDGIETGYPKSRRATNGAGGDSVFFIIIFFSDFLLLFNFSHV